MKVRIWMVALAAFAALTSACDDKPSKAKAIKPVSKGPAPLRNFTLRPAERGNSEFYQYRPLPPRFNLRNETLTPERIELGRMLFFDERFSKNHDVSCNTCHPLDSYGMDGEDVSTGHRGQTGTRNAPTVYNAAGQSTQFWDGRERTVEDQAKRPVLNEKEMAMPDEERVLATIRSMPEYVKEFQAAFPEDAESITYDNFGKAIGAFERTLVTPSRWDDFLASIIPKYRSMAIAHAQQVAAAAGGAAAVGKGSAAVGKKSDAPAQAGAAGAGSDPKPELTEQERRGFLTFYQVGCPSCHDGPLIGGALFEKLGKARPWPNLKDTGRGELTGRKDQDMTFKVASLRNVAKTAPYFHDASSTDLHDAVKRMAMHQLGVTLTDSQADDIVAWLNTLTGRVPEEYYREPKLPKSTKDTPKPDPT